MKRIIFIAVMLCITRIAHAQTIPWVTKQYAISSQTVDYVTAVDYGNRNVTLKMDISKPINDPPRSCGRPLMIVIHGGAFISGSRTDAKCVEMREDFAKRGYVTASIDYRLGMFQTHNAYGCALATMAGQPWDCVNAADTLEWYRALHRGIQDAHAAIRYIINNNANYGVDPRNVFVVGESAGAFIAMGVGYIDTPAEQLSGTGLRPNALQPNAIYVNKPCTGTTANMNLARPSLGSYLGTGNFPSQSPYTIRGVGDFFGGCFKNPFLVNANNAQIPALYVFHQIGDQIVAHNSYYVMGLLAYCLVYNGICPTYMINVPIVHGGTTVKNWVNTLVANGQPRPVMQAEIVFNPKDCVQQFWSQQGAHDYDNYGLRTGNMATFFSSKIVACTNKSGDYLPIALSRAVEVYPNPSSGEFNITLESGNSLKMVEVYDLMGKRVIAEHATGETHTLVLPESVAKGTYVLHLSTMNGTTVRKIILD
jgi:alpha/beta superfamily hydrolase